MVLCSSKCKFEGHKQRMIAFQTLFQFYTMIVTQARNVLCLRGHNWVHFAHRLQCTVTLNSNFNILKPEIVFN